MAARGIDALPGFRRRFVVTPAPGSVRAAVEDDYHCMAVTVRHTDGVASTIEPVMQRAPWSTCPGAEAQLRATFEGVALAGFAARGDKFANCTHLHDLATLAAGHAGDAVPTTYDILVSDPVDGLSRAEIRRDGATLIDWTIAGFRIVAPAHFAGVTLDRLKPVLLTLDPAGQEAARLLRWGIMIASGRAIPLAAQSDATRMPPNCFTFQPDRAPHARRIGVIRDFSGSGDRPLDGRVSPL